MASAFNESLLDLLRHVDCRRAETAGAKEAIYRLRYRSYLREGAVSARADERMVDRYDEAAGTWNFGMYIAGALASSIRLSIGSFDAQDIPANQVFPDILGPMFAAGKTVVDPTRFVVDQEFAKQVPKLPYATVRVAWLAQAYLGAEVLLATVRSEHQAFYKRLFGHRLLCPARPYPSLLKPISLMAVFDDPEQTERTNQRYPFLASTAIEREALFGGGGGGPRPRPSAGVRPQS